MHHTLGTAAKATGKSKPIQRAIKNSRMCPRNAYRVKEKIMASRLSTMVSMIVFLSGCGFTELSNRTTNPVVLDLLRDDDWLGAEYRYETISTDASRRTIFVRYRKGETRADFVCAEPSPDALQAYASAIAAAAEGGSGGIEAAFDFSSTDSTSAAPLLYRSQGLQLFRDQIFNLCIMMMNGTIKNDEYLVFPRVIRFYSPRAHQGRAKSA